MEREIGNIADFRTGEKRKILVNGESILLFYMGGERFMAFQNYCPHLGCDLSKVGIIIREELICQCHFTHFSVTDGKVRKGATKNPIKVFRTSVRDGKVYIDLS